jgi:hypothetical protein
MAILSRFQDFFYSLNAGHQREPGLLAIRCMPLILIKAFLEYRKAV